MILCAFFVFLRISPYLSVSLRISLSLCVCLGYYHVLARLSSYREQVLAHPPPLPPARQRRYATTLDCCLQKQHTGSIPVVVSVFFII
jgi:hypothetical protein